MAVLVGVFALIASSISAAAPVEAADGQAKNHDGSRGTAAVGLVRAAATGDSASESERTRLRGELDRLNREIDGLKQRRRSLGEDYALRAKMADAEAKARRLTELEGSAARSSGGRAGGGGGAAATTAAAGGGEPRAPLRLSPTPQPSAADDSEVLDAKADILADQARRVGQQADLLEHRVLSLRGRQELRRRAGELELDPFSPFEQSKRRIPIGAAASSLGASTASAPGSGSQMPDRAVSGGSVATSGSAPPGIKGASTNSGAVLTAPTTPASSPPQSGAASFAGSSPGATGATGATGPAVATSAPSAQQPGGGAATDPSGRGIGTVVAPGSPESTTSTSQSAGTGIASGTDAAGSLAGQFRDVLDPVTLTEIRRLEGSGGAARASLPATERALAALRARARQLQSEADATRRAAHPGPGQRP
jgi:hypothetical protein